MRAILCGIPALKMSLPNSDRGGEEEEEEEENEGEDDDDFIRECGETQTETGNR